MNSIENLIQAALTLAQYCEGLYGSTIPYEKTAHLSDLIQNVKTAVHQANKVMTFGVSYGLTPLNPKGAFDIEKFEYSKIMPQLVDYKHQLDVPSPDMEFSKWTDFLQKVTAAAYGVVGELADKHGPITAGAAGIENMLTVFGGVEWAEVKESPEAFSIIVRFKGQLSVQEVEHLLKPALPAGIIAHVQKVVNGEGQLSLI